jgi:two-component system NtrC family sensor kinase
MMDLPYHPHDLCLLYDPWIIALHVTTDLGIALIYFAIPATLWYFARQRPDFPFRSVVVWFGAFTACCACTHVGAVLEVWWPIYPVTGVIKLVTVAVSVVTLGKLVPILSVALDLPSLVELAQMRAWMRRPREETLAETLRDLDRLTALMQRFTSGGAP